MTRGEARQFVVCEKPTSIAWIDALRVLCQAPNDEDLPLLLELFSRHRSWLIRTDIVDALGLLKAVDELRSIAKGNNHYWVRRYALWNLIELRDERWDESRTRRGGQDYWQSLDLFAAYVAGEVSADQVVQTAKARHEKPGDFWEWLMNESVFVVGTPPPLP